MTYFYRNSRAYDTLMQMERWFGYRPNYSDLCRVWTSQEIIDWYGYIADVSSELKKEIKFMQDLGKTPKEFGLKVRRPVELNRIFIETPRLINDEKILSDNKNLVLNFIDGLNKFKKQAKKNFWRGIPKNKVAELVLNFQVGLWQQKFQGQPLSEYIMTKMDDKLWDVFIPEGEGEPYNEITVGGKKIVINLVTRKFLVDENQISLSGTKLRLIGREIAQVGLTTDEINSVENKFYADIKNKDKELPAVAYLITGRKPLLILYVVQPKIETTTAITIPKILFALGIGFPALDPKISESQINTADFVINAVGNKFDSAEGVEE